jgi:hypothetical protein
MPATVQVEGLREYIRALEQAGVEVEDMKDVFGEIASESADVARPVVPRRTGALAGTVRGNRAKNKAVVTIGKARTPYAGPIIWGWPSRGIRASPVVPRTNQYMETRAPELLETGLERLMEGLGL